MILKNTKMTYEQIMKSNASRIRKFGGMSESSMYSGISTGDGYLQYDQEPIAFMSERMKPFDVNDHRNPPIITNTPHTKDIERRIREQIQDRLIKPDIVYRRVSDSARTLPYIERLEELLSPIYSNKLIENIIRLNTYAPTYFKKILSTQISFEKYQEFFYLLILIKEVDNRKQSEEFQQLQEGIKNVIEWVRTRVIEDIDYFIQGPVRNQMVTLDYEETYRGLISPSNTTATVNEYLQLTTLQKLNDQLTLTRNEANTRKNVYDKNPNIAGSYLLSIDSELNADLYVNTTQDLVVDCQRIDLGNSNSEKVDLNIHSAELSDKLLKHDPKNASKKLENLMNTYTIFSIKNLLVLKSTYKTSLDAFDKIYVVFPGITMDGRFNQVYTTGTLQISGHFKQSDVDKYWEFVPDSDIGNVYNPTTVHVESFEFYISNNPGSKTNLSYNNFKIDTHLNEYFNCPIIVQDFEELDPNVYIIRLNDITEGQLKILPHTFIYNKNIKTIQLLPTNYEYDTIPRYNAKKTRHVQQKYEANVYPTQPSTIDVILDAIPQARREAKLRKESTVSIFLDKPVQPATPEGIRKRIDKGETSWTFRGQTVDFSGKTVEQIVKEFNQREYDITNVVDFTKDYIDKLTASTITFKGKKYNLIKPNGQRMTGTEFFANLRLENILDFAGRVSDELMKEYAVELNRFDKNILPEQVNPVFTEPKPEDFASLSEFYLFKGLFLPDYDYVIENSTDTNTVNGQYATTEGRLEKQHKYSINDFYAKDFTTEIKSVENPEHDETVPNIVETKDFRIIEGTQQCEITTTITRYPNNTSTSSSEIKNYTLVDDNYIEIDYEKYLKSGEIIKYSMEYKTFLTFENKISSCDFIEDDEKLYIQFKDSDLVIYENTNIDQHISNAYFERDVKVPFGPESPLIDTVIFIKDINYNSITFSFMTGLITTTTDVLEVEIGGVRTTYYKQIPGFLSDLTYNMYRELGNDVYELITFETTNDFVNMPDDSDVKVCVVKNKTSILLKQHLIPGNNIVQDLKLHINYGMAYVGGNTFDIVEKLTISENPDVEAVNFLFQFNLNDLEENFPSTTSSSETDWKNNEDFTQQFKDELKTITQNNQELYLENNNYNFEFYITNGIKDIKTIKTYKFGDIPTGDIMGVIKDNIDNEYNIINHENFGFKGKYFTYPITYTDPEKQASEEEIKKCICGDIFGYLDENGKFVEIYYVQYNMDNTLNFEVINRYPGILTYNNQLKFDGLWRRTTLNIKTHSAFDINNIISVEFVNRTIPLEDNIFKTFKIEADILNIKFGIDDYLYSFAKFIGAKTLINKPYRELQDLKIKDVGYYERLEYGNSGFDDPVKPKYFINYISHFKPGLIVNSKNYGFNTYMVGFKDSEYILETINKDLFGISYKLPIKDPDNFYSRGSRIKMIVELK